MFQRESREERVPPLAVAYGIAGGRGRCRETPVSPEFVGIWY